jgi:hypothetical protein
MKKTPSNRKTTIDAAHAKSDVKQPHDRDQLRRRLLKMILQNESQRRASEIKTGRVKAAPAGALGLTRNLAVFDPEDLIGKELAASNTPQKPA